MQENRYDVIIVGGGPAGCSLAARLAVSGMRILVLEKDALPERTVISCSLFLASGMRLMDEIGISEVQYTAGNPKLAGAVLEMAGYFKTFVTMPEVGGRNYLYGIRRELLDNALWNHLQQFPNVTAIDQFSVTDINNDEKGSVKIISGTKKGAGNIQFFANAVIGADGRNSIVARKMKAPVIKEEKKLITTVYYAYWENVAPYKTGGKEWVHIHSGCNGFSTVVMPAGRRRTGVLVQCRHDYFKADEGADAWYLQTLSTFPSVNERLKNARRVTPLKGIKNVSNLFRKAFGPGWVLVGDAYHQKDSYDAQGIYDALTGAKMLSGYLIAWYQKKGEWDALMQQYESEIYRIAAPMFKSTMERLKRELFTIPPPFVAKTLMRWMLTSPLYKNRFARLISRQVAPDKWAPPSVVLRSIVTGALRDLTGKRKE
ncbi:hypothetical protein A8C56_00840 [Niabella ginsenosidivorans]|uniref:FAD-binding domain-containing protein n=1 Tax=Niabella ginsenosidivorans TaxID=1176587 RepID=A0A1A9HWU9_9BACT|nr:NAD(P)/FAD-dependent oxidoreductase [Niabella ginsenosidivorans]ANH79713.1 hypothetical protein A8C56_00840 [Niabella ginsenosidivorans]